MEWYYILLIVLGVLLILVLITSFICYNITFDNRKRFKHTDELRLPDLEPYRFFKDEIIKDIKGVKEYKHTNITIKSFDGLSLYGEYYEYKQGAPIEIMMHGYRGNHIRDMSSGVKRAHACEHNALIIDQRAHGQSEGNTITFGVKERYDCLSWINYIIETFGDDSKIILTGVSMGAATVMNAAGMDLPKNVVGVLADCGYDSQQEMIKLTIKNMGLPVNVFYPFIKLGARIYGRFNLDETTPLEACKNIKLPIIFIHGDKDGIVPCTMCENLYNICSSNHKKLYIVKDAHHGIAYLKDRNVYVQEIKKFFSYIKE